MNPQKALAIKHNAERAAQLLQTLAGELGRGAPRLYLDHLVELCAIYVAQTGGTLVTAGLRGELTSLRALVLAVPAVAPTPTQETPTMYDIETAYLCPLCSAPGYVHLAGSGEFEAHCSECYDATEDSPAAAQASGLGKTAREAVAEWLECAEGHVPENVGYWPTDVRALVAAEARRTQGWTRTETARGILFEPGSDVEEGA